MNDQDLRSTLKQFGFSEKEIATYLVILDHGMIEVSDLADEAEISVRYGYNVVEQLERRGLIVVNNHVTPTTIRAIPPSESISQLKDDLLDVESELNTRFEEVSSNQQVEVFKTQSPLINRIRENINKAENEILMSIPTEAVPEIADDLRKALDRGVFVLLLLTNVESPIDKADTIASVVRTTKVDFPLLMTFDSNEGIISPPDVFRQINSHKLGIHIQQHQLIPILFSAFLGNYWRIGEELYINRPDTPPRKHTMFRHAVFDATCYLHQGMELYVDMKVRSLLGGVGFETISGQVIDTEQSIIEPFSSSLPVKNTIFVKTNDTVISVGGQGAFLEEYEVKMVHLLQ